MKKYIILILVFIVLIITSFQTETKPSAEIKSKQLKVSLLLPDTLNGYYMGTRFDWSGVISSLEYKGHNFFGKWFDKYDPTIHDAIMGPVEEYFSFNYNEAKPGENFIMIGIGVLKKPEEKSQNRFGYYQILNHGTWKVRTKPDQIQFVHKLSYGNYSYEYIKTIRLSKDKPVMEILHTLKNTGTRSISTNMYNHNFFVIDNQPIGPDFEMIFPYNISGEGQGIGTIAEIKENKLTYKRNLVKGETVFCGSLTGFKNDPKDLDIRVENKKTGAGVRITGDRSLAKLIFWACPTTMSPETYIDLNIKPGEEFSWRFNYEFYTFEAR